MVEIWFKVPFIAVILVMLVMLVMNVDDEEDEPDPVVILPVAELPIVLDADVAIALPSVPAGAAVMDVCPPSLVFAAAAVAIELDVSVEEVVVAVLSEDAVLQGMLTP